MLGRFYPAAHQHSRSDVANLWWLLSISKRERWTLVLGMAFIATASASALFAALSFGHFVGSLRQASAGSAVWYLAMTYLAAEAATIVCQYLGRHRLLSATTGSMIEARRRLCAKLHLLPMSYFDKHPLGKTLTRLTSDVEGMESFFSGAMARLLVASSQIVLSFCFMLASDVAMGWMVVAACLPSLCFTYMLRHPGRYWLAINKQRSAALHGRFAEFVRGRFVIRGLGKDEWSQKVIAQDADSHLDSGLRLMGWNSFVRPVSILLAACPILVVLLIGSARLEAGLLTLPLFVAFIRYSERFATPIRSISQEIQVIQEAFASADRIRRMLAEPEEVMPDQQGGCKQPVAGGFVFADVSVTYHGNRPALKNTNVTIAAGEKMAIIGRTGSGKSTFVNLIPRLYVPTSGTVFLDGVPLSQWDINWVRQHIGYLGQEPVILRGTVQENLLLGYPTGDLNAAPPVFEQIMAACVLTGFAKVLAKMPQGLATTLYDGGSNLSVGERQLLAITRMTMRSPKIIILDEPTASLDEETEKTLLNAILAANSSATVLLITHRYGSYEGFSRILEFKQGVCEETSRLPYFGKGKQPASLGHIW